MDLQCAMVARRAMADAATAAGKKQGQFFCPSF